MQVFSDNPARRYQMHPANPIAFGLAQQAPVNGSAVRNGAPNAGSPHSP